MDIKAQTCCFTGHRKIPFFNYVIKKRLEMLISELVSKDVIYYCAGGELGFDTLAAEVVLKMKKTYPQIKLILVLPCKNQTKGWKDKDIEVYENIKSKCDKYIYTAQNYYAGCMFKRNRFLVDNSNFCICYLTEKSGGTAYTVNYAKRQGLIVNNVAEKIK